MCKLVKQVDIAPCYKVGVTTCHKVGVAYFQQRPIKMET